MKLAFIGLGVMGYPMAGHLAKAGYSICCYNRTSSKAIDWQSNFNGCIANTPADAALDADIILVCVGNDDDVREVITGNRGIITNAKPGAVIVDHTTTSADVAREMDSILAKREMAFIDAPVSGGQAGAEKGQLTIMCGGDNQTYQNCHPVMAHYARQIQLMGPAGSGQLTKMVNQICIAGLVQSLAEGVQFCINSGLDVDQVFDVIGKGAAQSWQMDNRYATMKEGKYEHGFAVDWMRKDLGICLKEASKNGSHLPIAALVDQFYSEVQNMGGGRWDTSSLLARLLRS